MRAGANKDRPAVFLQSATSVKLRTLNRCNSGKSLEIRWDFHAEKTGFGCGQLYAVPQFEPLRLAVSHLGSRMAEMLVHCRRCAWTLIVALSAMVGPLFAGEMWTITTVAGGNLGN